MKNEDVIAMQLKISAPQTVELETGGSVRLIPAHRTPAPQAADRHVSLNGGWSVLRWPFPVAEEALCARQVDVSDWAVLEQPGRVFYADPEVQSRHIPGWDRRLMGHVDSQDGAVLRRRVRVPESWRGKRVFLRFDAVYPAARFYLNGVCLGEHLSGLTPFECEVTAHVAPGDECVVAVRLLRRYEGSEIDMPRHSLDFAGISQDAYLFAVEDCHLADYHIVTVLNPDNRSGRLEGVVRVRNASGQAREVKVTMTLDGQDGADQHSVTTSSMKVGPGEERDICLGLDAPGIRLWSDEHPNLYRVSLVLTTEGSREVYSFRTGFRRLELTGGRPTLNGHPVKIRGVNHLTFHPEHGLYTPREWLRSSLALMKKANVNGIRTHYAAPPALADLCDEMGFYLIQEIPIDWWGHWLPKRECVGPVFMRLESLARRDRHHVSLVAFSIGNENLPGSPSVIDVVNEHMHLFHRLAKRLAPDRYTMFPPPGPANKIRGHMEPRWGDIADVHYNLATVRQMNETGSVTLPRSWEGPYETLTREELMERGWSGTWFSSEYCLMNLIPDVHRAPYASIITDHKEDPLSGKYSLQVFMERMEREWGYMRDDPTCLGGAFFPWMCSGSGRPFGWTLWGEDADWGVVTSDLMPKPFFWALRTLFSPVQFPGRVSWTRGQKSIAFEIHNGYTSHDLSACTLRTMQGPGGEFMGILRDWQDVPVACPPGESVTLEIPLWNAKSLESLAQGLPVVCRCHLLDPSGFRPITADILVVPEFTATSGGGDVVPLGPDATL